MIEALFNEPDYLATKKMLDATTMRQEAIASNLANIETPGYKRVDLAPGFEAQLKQAVASGNEGELQQLQPELATDTLATASRTDGNTVSLESELLKMNQNTLEDNVETQIVTYHLGQLRMAVNGHA